MRTKQVFSTKEKRMAFLSELARKYSHRSYNRLKAIHVKKAATSMRFQRLMELQQKTCMPKEHIEETKHRMHIAFYHHWAIINAAKKKEKYDSSDFMSSVAYKFQ